PEFVDYSPNGNRIYYQANDSAKIKDKMYSIRLDGSDPREVDDKVVTDFLLSPDEQKILYTDEGDIWIADPDYSNEQRIIKTNDREYNAVWAPNSKKIAYSRNGDVWTTNIQNGQLVQVTDKAEDAPGYRVLDWAGTDQLILSQTDRSDFREYYFPEYVQKYVQVGPTERGIARQIVSLADLSADTMSTQLLYEQKGYIDTDVSTSGRYLAIDEMDAPMKHRKILVFDLQEPQKATTVFEDSTKGWLFGVDMEFAPDGNKLMFLSEKDGWNHIYTVNTNGSNLQQQTDGDYEVPWAEWTDGSNIVFASTEADPGERHIYTLNVEDGSQQKLTDKIGFRKGFHLNRDHDALVYQYTYFNKPFELYGLDLENPSKERQITHTVPDRFNQIDWQKEDYIHFTGSDGSTKLSMSVLEPTDLQPNKKYPVVVYVHGACSLHKVYKGWSASYFREYMFNQYLTAHGYYVMEVDYRHSTGYGRRFREDVTNWMGKYETQDIIDGIDYLAAHYEQADTSSVGVYGGSYGGFMSLYATSVAPDYFDAAAALRAVTNWENYYHTNPWYTLTRLGKPEADSVNYAQSSPITYVDQLEQPVLILHGLMDNNVGFQDAAEYIHELIQAGDKDFGMMMYPTERHSFQDPDAWYDEYSRI